MKSLFIYFLLICALTSSYSNNKLPVLPEAASTAETTKPVDKPNKEEWYCTSSNGQHGWSCQDIANTKLLEKNQPTNSTIPPTTALHDMGSNFNDTSEENKTVKLIKNGEKSSIKTTSSSDKEDLLAYPENYVVIQLMAAQKRSSALFYQRSNPHLSPQLVILDTNNRKTYLLLLGVYSNYSKAKAAINELNPAPTTEPWIRPLANLQEQIRLTK